MSQTNKQTKFCVTCNGSFIKKLDYNDGLTLSSLEKLLLIQYFYLNKDNTLMSNGCFYYIFLPRDQADFSCLNGVILPLSEVLIALKISIKDFVSIIKCNIYKNENNANPVLRGSQQITEEDLLKLSNLFKKDIELTSFCNGKLLN